jgi:hypothetical protein
MFLRPTIGEQAASTLRIPAFKCLKKCIKQENKAFFEKIPEEP